MNGTRCTAMVEHQKITQKKKKTQAVFFTKKQIKEGMIESGI